MIANFTFNFVDETIVATKKALKAASNPTTPEYKELMKRKKQQPTFKIVEREIKKNLNKTTYKGLTVKKMEAYILGQEDGEHILKAFRGVIADAKKNNNGTGYAVGKKWFLDEFNGISMKKIEAEITKTAYAKNVANATKRSYEESQDIDNAAEEEE